jgi:uncharacterized membrane protein YjjB (DUF3815 family)
VGEDGVGILLSIFILFLFSISLHIAMKIPILESLQSVGFSLLLGWANQMVHFQKKKKNLNLASTSN